MGNNKKNTPVVNTTAGVNNEVITPTVTETPAVITPAVTDTPAVTETPAVITPAVTDTPAVTETHQARVIPTGVFISENGDEFEFTVSSFTFQGKVYNKEEALSDHADVLEHLISVKSFILKKV